MTKREYMASLERFMAGLDAQERQAQLDYYSEMFDDMIEDGLTEEEAAARLETARREAGEPTPRLPEASVDAASGKKMTARRRWKLFFIGALVAVLLVPAIMIVSKVLFGIARSGAGVEDAVEAVFHSAWDDLDWSGAFQPSGHYTVDPVAEKVDSLDISWMSGDVKVTAWENDYIDFDEGARDAEYALRWCVDDGTLYIQDYRTVLDAGRMETKDLTVQLPRSLASELNDFSFEGVSADLTAEGLYADNFTAEIGSGVVRAEISCENAELDSVSGDLYFSGHAVNIHANTSGGRITIEGNETLEMALVEVRSVSGAMSVSGAVSDLEAHTTSGAVTLAVEGVTELCVDTVSGNVSLALPEDLRAVVDFGTVSGKVENHLPQVAVNPKGDAADEFADATELRVSTTSGDLMLTAK